MTIFLGNVVTVLFLFGTLCVEPDKKGTNPKPVETNQQETLMMTGAQTDTVLLEDYLLEMGKTLECHFTIEDTVDIDAEFPWIIYLDVVPDYEIETIDELVQKLNEELEGVTVVRSTITPSVVHLIADDAHTLPNYVMNEKVDVEYSGLLAMLPEHLGTIFDGRIRPTIQLALPLDLIPDWETEVEINVQNEKVRNVLTNFMPLENRFTLWETRPFEIDNKLVLSVTYSKAQYEPDE